MDFLGIKGAEKFLPLFDVFANQFGGSRVIGKGKLSGLARRNLCLHNRALSVILMMY